MEEILMKFAKESVAVLSLIWAITYMGKKVDRLENALRALGVKIDDALKGGEDWKR